MKKSNKCKKGSLCGGILVANDTKSTPEGIPNEAGSVETSRVARQGKGRQATLAHKKLTKWLTRRIRNWNKGAQGHRLQLQAVDSAGSKTIQHFRPHAAKNKDEIPDEGIWL